MINVRPYIAGQPITEPGIYENIPMAVYHGRNLVDGPRISSSGLRTIFSESPLKYWKTSPLNPKRKEPKESEAFILGRAAHHIILGEADFRKHYSERPSEYDSWKTKAAREHRAKELLDGRSCLDEKQIEAIRGIAGVLPDQDQPDEGLRNCDVVVSNGLLKGLIEHSLVWRDKETGVWLCSRPDAIPQHDATFVDLKTTADADEEAIRRTLGELRYDMQAALARIGLRELAGIDLKWFCFVFVQKTSPYLVNPIEVTRSDMENAEADLRAAIRFFARCYERKSWPGRIGKRVEAITTLGMTPWQRKWADERRGAIDRELAEA